MNTLITNNDLSCVERNTLDLSLKIEVVDENQGVLGVIHGNVTHGGFEIKAESGVRRTCNIDLVPDSVTGLTLGPDGLIWMNRSLKLYIGVKDHEDYSWYSQGYYYFEDAQSSYDATTNTLSLSLSDYIITLDGTKSGSTGAAEPVIPAYTEDPDTGEVISHNIIRDAFIQVLNRFAHIKNYMVDDIGEFNAMPDHNDQWEAYRQEHPLWNAIPYDLEFEAGCTSFDILTRLCELYPNYEMFYDTEGVFVCRMVPSCRHDDISIPDEFLQKVLISEDFSVNMNTVRNICLVCGETFAADFFPRTCTYENNIYSAAIEGYKKYTTGDMIAITVPESNTGSCSLKINALDPIPILMEAGDVDIDKDSMIKDKIYVLKIKYLKKNGKMTMAAYLLGQWQARALNALVDGSESTQLYTTSDGLECPRYSVDYFRDVYDCDTVTLTIIPNSPFTVQRIGELPDVKKGGSYDNITSDSLALENAEYENWKNCRLTDSITIKTKIVPFADVNLKCSYKRSDSMTPGQYIIKSLSHSFSDGTTTWEMYRFYPLYQDTLKEAGTHKTLSDYKHGLLGKYAHEHLLNFIPGGIYE